MIKTMSVRRTIVPVLVVLAGIVLTGCTSPAPSPLSPPGDGGEFCQRHLPSDGVLAFGVGEAENRANFPVTVTGVELVDAVGMDLVGTRALYIPLERPAMTIGAQSGWPPDFMGHDELERRFHASGTIEGSTIEPSTETKPTFAIGVRAQPGAHSGPLRLTYRHGDDEWTWTGSITFRVGDDTSC